MKKVVLIMAIVALFALSVLSSPASTPNQAPSETYKLERSEKVRLNFNFPAGQLFPVVPRNQCLDVGNTVGSPPKYRWCAMKGGEIALTSV